MAHIRSLLPKMDEVRHCLSGKIPPAIIAFTETWLDDTIVDGEIAVQCYSVYRKDRNRHGGGIAVYVVDRLKVTRRNDLKMDDIELIWLELRERATRRALFGAVYITIAMHPHVNVFLQEDC